MGAEPQVVVVLGQGLRLASCCCLGRSVCWQVQPERVLHSCTSTLLHQSSAEKSKTHYEKTHFHGVQRRMISVVFSIFEIIIF